MPDTYVTIRGVELAKVGDWPTYRGDGTITREHLQDVVAAASDRDIRAALHGDPVGWLGHVDGAEAAEARQSDPGIGRVTNLRTSSDGDTLVGDLVDIPERVARLYPRRSVELQADLRTPAGRTYSRVLSGLAFLGRTRPAIRGLRDLNTLLDGRASVLAADGGGPILFAEDEPQGQGADDLSHLTPEQAATLGYVAG